MNVRIITRSGKSNRQISSPFRRRITRFPGPVRKIAVTGLFFLASLLPLAAQKPVDFVVLLDNSESMFRQNGNRVELVVTEIMKNRLGYQDSFHLISFSGEPDFEISRVLRDHRNIEDVLAHLMMIQPVNEFTDIVSALGFTTDYISGLPLHTVKHLLILSDDVHEPNPEGNYRDTGDNLDRIQSIAEYVKRNGWKINIVLLPELEGTSGFSGDQSAGIIQRGLLAHLAGELGIEAVLFEDDMSINQLSLPEGTVPVAGGEAEGSEGDAAGDSTLTEGDGSSGSGFKLDTPYIFIIVLILLFILIFLLIRRFFGSSGTQDSTVVRGIRSGDEEVLKKSPASGEEFDVLKSAKKRSFADRETPYGDYKRDSGKSPLPLREEKKPSKIKAPEKDRDKGSGITGGAAALTAFASREKDSGGLTIPSGLTRRTPALGSAKDKKASPPQKSSLQGKPGQTAIEMKVDFQKNKLGHNMHWFDPSTSFSVGEPGVSDFEIHSIDVTGVIGTIRRSNENYTFNADQPEYFPEIQQLIENCLGRTIRITSPDTGYTTSIVFKPWISTLERLNKLLHMTDKAGKPDPDIEI